MIFKELKQQLDMMDTNINAGFNRLARRLDTFIDNEETTAQPAVPDRTWLGDYSKLNDITIMKHSKEQIAELVIQDSLADVKALISWSQPDYAGPLFYTVLNGIVTISRSCYGYSHSKRSFLRFLSEHMSIESPLSDLLYHTYSSIKQNGLLWCKSISIGAGFVSDDLFRIHNKAIIDINVIALTKHYIDALEQLDTTEMNNEMPISENDILVTQVIEYLRKE